MVTITSDFEVKFSTIEGDIHIEIIYNDSIIYLNGSTFMEVNFYEMLLNKIQNIDISDNQEEILFHSDSDGNELVISYTGAVLYFSTIVYTSKITNDSVIDATMQSKIGIKYDIAVDILTHIMNNWPY